MLNYLLYISGAGGTQNASSAFLFSCALLKANQSISAIFFYEDGVYNANRFISPPNDEINLVEKWADLSKMYKIPLLVCASAALKRGVIMQDPLNTKEKMSNFHSAFTLSSLTELAKEITKCDRFIQF